MNGDSPSFDVDPWAEQVRRSEALARVAPEDRAMVELAMSGRFKDVDAQVRRVGACEHPIWLRGRVAVFAVATGALVDEFLTADAPFGKIAVRCGNRRASRCAPCSRLYQADAFHQAMAGLVGGKGVPAEVALHPMVFATLTAPSFGAVHRKTNPDKPGDRCRPRRGDPVCEHGNRLGCLVRHSTEDRRVGQPLCPWCYDYPGHVLFNAHASRLWGNLVDTVYHRLASVGGVDRAGVRRLLRVEYFKVAEYQARGLVHFHVALRLDSPTDRAEMPPAWVTSADLVEAIVSAASVTRLETAYSPEFGARTLAFGAQLDARPLELSGPEDEALGLAVEKAAGYLVKYLSKGLEEVHGSDVPIRHRSQVNATARTEHVRVLEHTCLTMAALAGYAGLGTGRWAHMLGYRGHALTRSRRFSITFASQRAERAAHERGVSPVLAAAGVDPADTVRVAELSYAGSGWPGGAVAEYAAEVRQSDEEQRQISRQAREAARTALAEERADSRRAA